MTLVKAMGIVAGSGYLLVIVAALCLPETKGKVLGATPLRSLNPPYITHENDCSRRRRDRRRHALFTCASTAAKSR